MIKSARKRTKKNSRKSARSARPKPKSKSPRPASAKPSRPSKGPRPKPVVIDVHAHILVPDVMKVTYEQSQYAQTVAGKSSGGMPEPLVKRMTETPLRLEQMDATGVDIQVISPSIMQQCTYGLHPDQAPK